MHIPAGDGPASESGTDERSAEEPGAAARAVELIAQARDSGGSAISRLAERFTREIAMGKDGESQTGHSGSATGARSASPLRSLRREIDVALDEVSELLRGALDTAEGLLDSSGRPDSSIESLHLEAEPGLEVHTTIWIHNVTPVLWPELSIAVALVDDVGSPFDGAVTVNPVVLAALEPGASLSAAVTILPSQQARSAEFHGLIIVAGADQVEPLHLRLSVRA